MKTHSGLMLLGVVLGSMHLACSACTPDITPNNEDSGREDSGKLDTQDSVADTMETAETGEPPPCAQPEVEPNGLPDEAQLIEMEQWACGSFTNGIDFDHLRVELDQEAWIKVDVRAADFGSSADPTMEMRSDEGDVIRAMGRYGSTDPYVLFPLWKGDDWVIKLWEAFGESSEEHTWEAMVSVAKQPTSWTRLESEEPLDEGASNDTLAAAESITEGEVIFGRLGSPNDIDWFRFEPPEGKTHVSIRVNAYKLGSPLDARLARYNSEGTQLQVAVRGEIVSDPDPLMEFSSDQEDDHYFVIRSDSHEGLGYWYTLWIEFGSDS
jgi:hypothetical protein